MTMVGVFGGRAFASVDPRWKWRDVAAISVLFPQFLLE